jgi:hypothetical protein
MADVLKVLEDEAAALRKRLRGLEQAMEVLGGDVAKDVKQTVKRGKKMSAATKAKLSKAAKARWAKVKKAAS